MKLLEFFTLMLLPLGGGTELIDFVPAKLFWSLKGIPITSDTMRAELQTKTAGDVSALIKQLGDAKFQLRRKAMRELLAKGPGVIPQLQRATKSKDREIATRSRQLLQRLTQNRGESRVRRLMAVKALGRLKHRQDLPVLRKLLKSTDPALAALARRTIAEIEGRSFKRKAVTRKQLDEDLWLLPKNCGLVWQLAIRKTIPVDADRVIKQFVAVSGKKKPNEVLRKFHTQLLKLINEAGNIRIDAITTGLSPDAGAATGFVVMIGRGFYDRAAAVRVFKKAKMSVVQKQGIDVVSIENEVLLLLVSNSRVIIMAGPNKAALPLEEILKSLKTGRGKLAENRPMVALIKSADRSGLLWGVSRKCKWYQETSVLAPLDSITVAVHYNGKSLRGTLTAKGSDAAKMAAAVSIFNAGLKETRKVIADAAKTIPALRPIQDFLRTLKIKNSGKTVTINGEVKRLGDFLMFPLIVTLGFGGDF